MSLNVIFVFPLVFHPVFLIKKWLNFTSLILKNKITKLLNNAVYIFFVFIHAAGAAKRGGVAKRGRLQNTGET